MFVYCYSFFITNSGFKEIWIIHKQQGENNCINKLFIINHFYPIILEGLNIMRKILFPTLIFVILMAILDFIKYGEISRGNKAKNYNGWQIAIHM